MVQPSDAKKLSYVNVLANWNWYGYITFSKQASEWARVNLEGIDDRELKRLMHEHVGAGGEIDQQKETRPTGDWKDRPLSSDYFDYHFDLRIMITGKKIYFETRLDDPGDPNDATIHVVNIHDA